MFLLTLVLVGLMVVPPVARCVPWALRRPSPAKTVRVACGDRVGSLYAAALLAAGGHRRLVVSLPPSRPALPRVYTTDEATGEVAAPAQTLRKYLDLLPLPPTLLRKVVTHRPLHDIPSAWEVRSADRLPRFVDVVRARDEHPWLAQQVVDPTGQRHLEEVLRAFVEARAPDTRFQDHSLGGPIDVRVPSTRHEFDEARVEMPARFATARSAYPVLTNLPCGTLSDEDRIVWDQRSGVAVRGYRRQPGDDTWCVEALRSGYAVRDIDIVLRELVPGIQRTYPEKRRVVYGTSIPSQLAFAFAAVEQFLGYDATDPWQRFCGRDYARELQRHLDQ